MNLDITKPRYSEQIMPVPWPFSILYWSKENCSLERETSLYRGSLCRGSYMLKEMQKDASASLISFVCVLSARISFPQS